MSGVFSKIAPCLIVLLALAAACLPTEGGPRNTLPASSPSTAAADAGGLKVHSGEVTKVSDSEYVLRTASNLNGDFYEAYFDFPVSLDQPFIIKLDVDYPASDIEDTVEVFLGDNSFGYQRATAAYWNDFYTSIQKRRLKIQKKMEIEEYNFGQKNTFAINAVDIASENYKNIFYQVFMNYLVSEEYNTPYKKDFRFGIRVRSKNGQSKTARVTNLVFLDSPDPLHLGRVRAARAQIFDDLKKYAGWETEFHQLSLKQAVYGGKNRAEILRNEKADIDRRVKKINEQD